MLPIVFSKIFLEDFGLCSCTSSTALFGFSSKNYDTQINPSQYLHRFGIFFELSVRGTHRVLKSIFLKNILAKIVSHRNLQKLPQLIELNNKAVFANFCVKRFWQVHVLKKNGLYSPNSQQ